MKIKLLFSFICLGSIGSTYSMSETPNEMLMRGLEEGDMKIVEEAITNKADVKGQIGATILNWASDAAKNVSLVKLLLENGANPNYYNSHNDTALMLVVRQNFRPIPEVLLENIDAFDPQMQEILLNDAVDHRLQIAELLLNHGADPDLQDESGITALMWAVRKDSKPMVKLLLDHGADFDVKINKHGQTALDIAKKEENKVIAELIENEYEKRRQQVHKEVVENSCLLPEVASIVSEYVVYPKKEKTK